VLVSLPFRLTEFKFERINRLMQIAAGVISVSLGLWIVYEKGFGEGLFS